MCTDLNKRNGNVIPIAEPIMGNSIMTDTTRKFSEAAKSWDDNPMRVRLAGAVTNAILNRIPVTKAMNALDYGAGTGLVTLGLQPHVNKLMAADSAQGMLDKLNEKVASNGLSNVETMLLDLEHDSVSNRQFDLIVSSMTFHHIRNITALIENLCSMLRTGRYLAIADLDLDDGQFHSDSTGVEHNGFDRSDMERIFIGSGLQNVIVETAHVFTKEMNGKGPRAFSVFLITGKKG